MTTSDPSYQPITFDDAWVKGEDQTFSFTAYDVTAAIQVITGWTLQFKLAATKGGANVLSIAATVTDGPNGVFTVTSAAAGTSALGITVDTVYQYEIRRTNSGSNTRVAWGPATLQVGPT